MSKFKWFLVGMGLLYAGLTGYFVGKHRGLREGQDALHPPWEVTFHEDVSFWAIAFTNGVALTWNTNNIDIYASIQNSLHLSMDLEAMRFDGLQLCVPANESRPGYRMVDFDADGTPDKRWFYPGGRREFFMDGVWREAHTLEVGSAVEIDGELVRVKFEGGSWVPVDAGEGGHE